MSAGVVILLAAVVLVAVVLLLVRFGPEPLDLLDLNPERRNAARMSADSDDMREMLELTNRDRRLAGRPEVTEDDLRYGPDG
jgi:hypothetical protein